MRLKIHESEILLNKTTRYFRQIAVSGNGHEKEAFILTNDRKRTASQIIRQYGKRWNIEKGISEQIIIIRLGFCEYGFFYTRIVSRDVGRGFSLAFMHKSKPKGLPYVLHAKT